MRAVIQRVHSASVVVDQETVGVIEAGLLVYLGAAHDDSDADVNYMVEKIAGLRIFRDEEGKMSRCVQDLNGAILVVSQFTLFGDMRKGRRPSFNGAAPPELAEAFYEQVVTGLRAKKVRVETGRFGAMMRVISEGDGPVTIQIDSKKLY